MPSKCLNLINLFEKDHNTATIFRHPSLYFLTSAYFIKVKVPVKTEIISRDISVKFSIQTKVTTTLLPKYQDDEFSTPRHIILTRPSGSENAARCFSGFSTYFHFRFSRRPTAFKLLYSFSSYYLATAFNNEECAGNSSSRGRRLNWRNL